MSYQEWWRDRPNETTATCKRKVLNPEDEKEDLRGKLGDFLMKGKRRMKKMLFTSESVTEGHPDKISDKISDAILDALLEQDPYSRVACETFCTTGLVTVMGEITTKAIVDFQKIVRETVREIGYTRAKYGFDCDSCGVLSSIHEQSPDIALGVDKSLEAKQGRFL